MALIPPNQLTWRSVTPSRAVVLFQRPQRSAGVGWQQRLLYASLGYDQGEDAAGAGLHWQMTFGESKTPRINASLGLEESSFGASPKLS